MSKCNYIQADIIETERLLVRKLTNDDFDTLLTIMGKPEVMYAWEHGFSEDDVQDWIEIFCRSTERKRTTDRPGRTYENNNERE